MFGDVVLAHRQRLGLTQEELADQTGLSVRGIRDLESGRVRVPRPVSVRRLADVFSLVGTDRERFYHLAAGSSGPPGMGRPGERSTGGIEPAQLPREVPGFTGRLAYLRQLDALLAAAAGPETTLVVAAIAGSAGVGKTALAVHWAHRVRDRFPDGQLYVNLRGFDPGGSAIPPSDALRGFLDALGVPAQRIPAGLAEQAALYRSTLAGRRMLVVLDNASTAEQVRPLLPGEPGCLVIVTSRNQLTSLVATDGAHPLPLDLLAPAEAWQLLAHRLGSIRVGAEPEAVDDIIASCARLPLALAIVAARAATHSRFSLDALAVELRGAWGGLDAFASADATADVRAVFSWSYQQLSPAAAGLFRRLGAHPGPDIAAAAAASLAGAPLAQVRPHLAELTDAHLLAEPAPGRYALHDLLRAYATEQALAHDGEAERDLALARLADHYLHTAHVAARLLDPRFHQVPLVPARPGVTPVAIADHPAAQAWFAAEQRVLVTMVHQAADAGLDTEAWKLAATMTHFLDRRGRWHDQRVLQHAALEAAKRAGDRVGQAMMLRSLGGVYTQLGRLAEARGHLGEALDLFTALGDQVGMAHAHHTLSATLERQGDQVSAFHHSQQALALYRAAGHRAGEARALNAVGWDHAQLGDYAQALAYCQEALALHREIGNLDGQAHTWDSLGYAHRQLGQHADALRCYRQALALRRELGDRYNEAATLDCLGDVHQAVGDGAAARAAWQQTLEILDELDHSDRDSVRTKLAGL